MYSTPQVSNIPYIPENPFNIPTTASPCPSTATSTSAVSSTTPPAWLPQLTPMPAASSTSKSEKKSTTKSPTHKIASSSPSKSKLHRCHHQECKYETDRRSNLNRHIVAMHERKIARSSHFCCGLHFENKAKQRLVYGLIGKKIILASLSGLKSGKKCNLKQPHCLAKGLKSS